MEFWNSKVLHLLVNLLFIFLCFSTFHFYFHRPLHVQASGNPSRKFQSFWKFFGIDNETLIDMERVKRRRKGIILVEIMKMRLIGIKKVRKIRLKKISSNTISKWFSQICLFFLFDEKYRTNYSHIEDPLWRSDKWELQVEYESHLTPKTYNITRSFM